MYYWMDSKDQNENRFATCRNKTTHGIHGYPQIGYDIGSSSVYTLNLLSFYCLSSLLSSFASRRLNEVAERNDQVERHHYNCQLVSWLTPFDYQSTHTSHPPCSSRDRPAEGG